MLMPLLAYEVWLSLTAVNLPPRPDFVPCAGSPGRGGRGRITLFFPGCGDGAKLEAERGGGRRDRARRALPDGRGGNRRRAPPESAGRAPRAGRVPGRGGGARGARGDGPRVPAGRADRRLP